MSKFDVTLERISSVEAHPNADRLDIVKMEGMDWEVITGRDNFKVGDICVFFPVDCVLPEDLSERLGVTKMLNKGRVKTVKLRGMFSQGYIERLDKVFEIGTGFKDMLGVVKYEVPDNNTYGIKGNRSKTGVDNGRPGYLVALPDGVVKYDLENAQNYKMDVDALMHIPVMVTEKVEGSHWGCTRHSDGSIQVFQRNFAINEHDEVPHAWHQAFRDGCFAVILEQIAYDFSATRVTIRGEITGPGIQGNYYDLKEAAIFVFEIEINDKPVDANVFYQIVTQLGMRTAPIMHYMGTLADFLGEASLKEISDGKSFINEDKAREGIVIKPMKEQYSRTLQGRLVLKQRGPEYLAKSGN